MVEMPGLQALDATTLLVVDAEKIEGLAVEPAINRNLAVLRVLEVERQECCGGDLGTAVDDFEHSVGVGRRRCET